MKSNGFESFWDEKEIDTLKEITERYEKVKGLFLYAEEIDNKITFLPASNEFRAAFDHLMRVFAFKFELKSAENAEYTYINLGKSYGHVYRAGYDLLDYLQLKLTKSILCTMEKYSTDTIQAVCPEYYSKIKRDLKLYAEEIAIIRSRKDVGNVNEEDFDKYVEIVDKIKSYDMAITKIEYLLAEFEQLTKNILYTMEKYSTDTIQAVCPEYYSKIKRDLKLYAEEIAIIRNYEDIENVNEADFDKYEEIVSKIKSYDTAISNIEYLLAEYELKRTRETTQERNHEARRNTFYTVVATLIATGILWAISSYFNKSSSFALKFSSATDISNFTVSNAMIFLFILVISLGICYTYCTEGN